MNKEKGRLAKGISGERSVAASRQRPKKASSPVESKQNKAASTTHRQATYAARSGRTLTRAPILRTFLLGRVALIALRYIQEKRLSRAAAATHQIVRKHPVPAVLLGAAVGYLLTQTKMK